MIIGAGTAIRIWAYLQERSLWRDEAALANGIAQLSLPNFPASDLGGQSAPLGFVVVAWALLKTAGPQEFVLRFIPLLSGILLMVVTSLAGNRVIRHAGARIFATAAISFSPPLIYYSQEFKQYSTDALLAILVTWLFFSRDEPRVRKILSWIMGIVALFSLTSLILIGFFAMMELAKGVASRFRGERGSFQLGLRILTVTIIFGSVQLSYQLISLDSGRDSLSLYWEAAGGLPPQDSSDALGLAYWFITSFTKFLTFTFWSWGPAWSLSTSIFSTITGGFIFAVFLLLTIAVLFGLTRGLDECLLWLIAPIAGTLLLAILGLYPFHSRLVLFLIPNVILIFARGVSGLNETHRKLSKFVAVFYCLISIGTSLVTLGNHLGNFANKNDAKSIIEGPIRAQVADHLVSNQSTITVLNYYSLFPEYRHIEITGIEQISQFSDDEFETSETVVFLATHREQEIASYVSNLISDGQAREVCRYRANDILIVGVVGVDVEARNLSELCELPRSTR